MSLVSLALFCVVSAAPAQAGVGAIGCPLHETITRRNVVMEGVNGGPAV